MAHSVQPYFVPSTTRGPDRRASGTGTAKSGLDGTRTLAGMLLAAVVAALLVVADQLMDIWADGHLLLAWVVLWCVAFGTLAVLAGPLRRVAKTWAVRLGRWSAARAQRRSDAVMWDLALQDYRVMQDLQLAMIRGQ